MHAKLSCLLVLMQVIFLHCISLFFAQESNCLFADDIGSCAGGTIARLSFQFNTRVVYVLTTNGDKGYAHKPLISSEELAVVRMKEQRAAAAVLGVKDVVFLDFEGEFE